MAIDTAVADGVDVINYSIGSNTPAVLSPDAVAFLFARDAGVFVATSAGNAGPDAVDRRRPGRGPVAHGRRCQHPLPRLREHRDARERRRSSTAAA